MQKFIMVKMASVDWAYYVLGTTRVDTSRYTVAITITVGACRTKTNEQISSMRVAYFGVKFNVICQSVECISTSNTAYSCESKQRQIEIDTAS